MKYILLLFSIILVLGCTSTQFSGMAIANGDNISVDYTGSLEDGTVFDSSLGRGPLEFSAGSGRMIRGFDAAVIGMHVGEEKNVTIKPEDAYGPYNTSYIVEVSIGNIPDNAKVGDTLYSGSRSVHVIQIGNETAMLDANHPLAGKTLIFKIRIVKIN